LAVASVTARNKIMHADCGRGWGWCMVIMQRR
jgi:hypothetical protein